MYVSFGVIALVFVIIVDDILEHEQEKFFIYVKVCLALEEAISKRVRKIAGVSQISKKIKEG